MCVYIYIYKYSVYSIVFGDKWRERESEFSQSFQLIKAKNMNKKHVVIPPIGTSIEQGSGPWRAAILHSHVSKEAPCGQSSPPNSGFHNKGNS